MIAVLKENATLRATLLLITGVVLFSVINVIVKDTGSKYPISQILAFRFGFALIPLLLFSGIKDIKIHLRPKNFGLCTLIGIALPFSVGTLFLAIKYLPLADAQAISFSSSLVVTTLALPVLGERVGVHRWISVVVGFIGVVIVCNPTNDVMSIGALYAMIFSISQGAILTFARKIMREDSPMTLTLFTVIIATLISAPYALFNWVPPSNTDMMLLVFMGLGSGIAQLSITSAYKYGEASFLSPFLYTALVWGILFDWLIWSHFPNMTMLLGSTIVIASNIYILFRERSKG